MSNTNGVNVTYLFDTRSRIKEQRYWTLGGDVEKRQWTFDSTGRISTEVVTVGSSVRTNRYGYDAFGR